MPPSVLRERYKVEPVQQQDLRTVMRLSWSQRSPPLPGLFFERAIEDDPDRFWVVRDDDSDAVVGFVLTARLPLRDRGMLLLAVRPELVGMGLRRALLHAVEAAMRAQGEQELVIEVPVESRELLDFYQREGFELVGRSMGMGGEELILAAPLTA